jgi:hypothetical protein
MRAHRIGYLVACMSIPAALSSQQNPATGNQAAEKQSSDKQAGEVQAQMHNVRFRFADNVAVHIRFLNGALVPAGNSEFPVFDDKNSFKIHIDRAEIAVSPADLANLMNSYVFAQPNSPLSGISVTTEKGQLKIKGRLRQKGNIPFETQGVMSATQDGRIRLHSEKIKALRIPVKGLMDALGIEISDLIKSGKFPGVQSEGDDLILDLEQILPPPHIDGKVTSVRVQSNSIIQTFGVSNDQPGAKPDSKAVARSGAKPPSGNYMTFRGGRLRFGKLTMDDADLILNDIDPADPLDFFFDRYKDQLAYGYTKISTSFQLRVFLKDLDKIGARAPATKKSSN